MMGRNDDDRDYIELSEIPEFDERSTRRMIRRGVLRTVLAVIGVLLLGSSLLQLGSDVLFHASGSEDRLESVAMPAISVRYPEYDEAGGGCCNTGITSSTGFVEFDLRSPTMQQTTSLELQVDLRGRLDAYSYQVPQSPLGSVVQGWNGGGTNGQAVLMELPDQTSASAVIVFSEPLDQAGVDEVLRRLGLPRFAASVLFDVPSDLRWVGSPHGSATRIGWPVASVAAFSEWAGSLSTSDDQMLHVIGLPHATDLPAIAERGASGLVVSGQPVPALRRLFEDRLVANVLPGEVTFDIGLDTNA